MKKLKKYQYQKGGKVSFEEFLRQQNKPIVNSTSTPIFMPISQQEMMYNNFNTPKQQHSLKKSQPQSKVSKAAEIALNPFTAAQYVINKQRIPNNFSQGKRNTLDYAADIVNPAFYTNAAKEAVTNTGEGFYNIAKGNYEQGLGNLGVAGLNALVVAPFVPKGAKKLENLLKNTWRLNPKAYQYNLPENTMWRGLGKEGMEDAVSSGLFRAKQNVIPEYYPGTKLQLNKSFGTNPYFTPKFKTAATYGDNYLAEVPRDAANWSQRYKRSDWSQIADRPIPIDEGRILQKDWLQGYKQINTPKQLPGSGNVVKAGFPNPLEIADRVIPRPLTPGHLLGMDDSWNYYSPLNLIPGYGKKLVDKTSSYPNFVGFRKFGNSIDDVIESQTLRPKGGNRMGAEQISKEGNWAEPGKVNEHYSGVFEATMNPQIPGSNIKLEKWNKRNGIVGTTKEGDVAIPLTDPGLSFNRRLPFSSRYVPIDKQKLIEGKFQLATQLPHVQSLIEKYGIWAGAALTSGYMMGGKEQALKNLKTVNKYSVDPIINWSKKQWEDFEKTMNAPPAAIIGAGAIEQKKQGGAIVTPRGQWDYPGKTTIIPSNEITMRDVPYPIVGVSNTGDVQYMQPGEDYVYDGDYVTEYPMMRRGGQYGGLDRWFAEKWIDVKTGKPCGRQEGENRAYPACRPSKRISSDTPKTLSELSSSERERFKREKTSSKRISYNHNKKKYGGENIDNINLEFMKLGGNVPTNSELYSRVKSEAKNKFNSWPSAYGSAWLVKTYKNRGGGYRKAEYGMEVMGNGGVPNNPGFNALPEYVQQNIINNMAAGGQKMPPQLAYARFAAAGNLDQLQDYGYKYGGGVILNAGGEKHRIYVKPTNRGEGVKGDIMVNHPTMDKREWDTINLTEKSGARTIAQGVAATKKWHKENPYKKQKGGEYFFYKEEKPILDYINDILKNNKFNSYISKMKKGGIYINPANKGKFTASANRAGMGVQEFARHVLTNKEDYSPTQVKRANFARNFGNNKKNGGELKPLLKKSKEITGGWDIIDGSWKRVPMTVREQPISIDLNEYKKGGNIPERYKNMGFTKTGVKKQSTRPGKKWMVLAKKDNQYKVVHGGWKGMEDFKQHGSEKRKENFWNRMGGKNSSKATNPFSPLYWHKKFGTW